MKLKQIIRKYRKQKNLTQMQVAVRADISLSVYANIENGRATNPTILTLVKIARALELNKKELLEIIREVYKLN